VLDLGCGTGKQIFRLAPLVADEGKIVGIDISQGAVQAVSQRAEAEGFPFIKAQQMGLDDCRLYLVDQRFDLIVSSYAIYYAQDAVAVLKGLHSLLNEQGVVFACGPGKGTNKEMQDIVNRYSDGAVDPIDDFLTPDDIRDVATMFSQFEVARLENHVVFDSADAVLSWWRNHNSFDISVAPRVEEYLHAHFSTNKIFSLTKNVLGVRFDV
jgi:ubiquinone/menaquinone biosynthesis C-methylase UbiE